MTARYLGSAIITPSTIHPLHFAVCSSAGPRLEVLSLHQRSPSPPSSFRQPSRLICSSNGSAEEASTSGRGAAEAEAKQEQQQPHFPPLLLRKVAAAADAAEALDVLAEGLGDARLTEADCRTIMGAALDRGNSALALAIFQAMTAAAAGRTATAASLMSLDAASVAAGSLNGALTWPPATVDTAGALVVGLCRGLLTREAVAIIRSVRSRGLPSAEDVQFGYVVECPLGAAGKPLAVMQPQEGVKAVADSYSRYEYELYSGTVTSITSESMVAEAAALNLSMATAALQRFGISWRPAAGAVHIAVVETPGGQQRTFRFGTPTADVPAKMGDRVTVVCSPQTPAFSRRRVISSAPPETNPGEPLSITNHTLQKSTPLVRPPKPGGPAGLPGWVIPTVAAFMAADAASSLVNPLFPYFVAGAVVSTAAAGLAGTKVVLPRLKQLPTRELEVQATRQKLLQQHTSLERRVQALVRECEEDVLVLARLWQLQAKMGAVAAGGTYDARLERVSEARSALEGRLVRRVQMLDAYAKVISMIEIEVEMETQVPKAEVEDIEVQIARLGEIEELQADWVLQAEAQDEVERLLRAAP